MIVTWAAFGVAAFATLLLVVLALRALRRRAEAVRVTPIPNHDGELVLWDEPEGRLVIDPPPEGLAPIYKLNASMQFVLLWDCVEHRLTIQGSGEPLGEWMQRVRQRLQLRPDTEIEIAILALGPPDQELLVVEAAGGLRAWLRAHGASDEHTLVQIVTAAPEGT